MRKLIKLLIKQVARVITSSPGSWQVTARVIWITTAVVVTIWMWLPPR